MPLPIKPVHSLEMHSELFDSPGMESDMAALSALQAQLLGGGITREAQAKLSIRTIEMLKIIESSQDDIITAAQSITMSNKRGETMYRVPVSISDHDLLGMKTAELIRGSGRSVTLTERGRVALRDHYLNKPENEFRKSRTKTKFDLNAAREVSAKSTEENLNTVTAGSKFKRIVN
jgi:hypothetical protein